MESFHACVSPQDFHTEAKEPELPLCLSPVSQGTAVGTIFLPVSQSKPHCSFHPQTHALFSTDNCCLQRCSRRRAGTSDTMRKRKMEPSGHCQLRFPYQPEVSFRHRILPQPEGKVYLSMINAGSSQGRATSRADQQGFMLGFTCFIFHQLTSCRLLADV